MARERKNFTLIDTTDMGLEYKDYVEFCEINEITPEPENSNDYWDWIGEETNRYIEDFFENLRYVKYDKPVIITGTLGLWNGRKEIYPMAMMSEDYYQTKDGKWRYKHPSIERAVRKCINGMDDFKVELSEGEIVVHGYHHDGTNILTIHSVSKKGEISLNNALEKGKQLEPKDYWYGKFTETDLY